MRYSGASVSGLILASPAAIWELVGNVTRHPAIAGSGEVREVSVVGDGPLAAGAVFESQQCLRGINYVTANRVVAWEPGRRFAWRIGVRGAPGVAQIWKFELSPEGGATRVENGVALLYAFPSIYPFSLARARLGRGYAASIRPTLFNLAAMLGAPPPAELVERHEPPADLAAQLPPPALQGAAVLAGGAALFAAARALRRSAR